jgi:hypothetical protein
LFGRILCRWRVGTNDNREMLISHFLRIAPRPDRWSSAGVELLAVPGRRRQRSGSRAPRDDLPRLSAIDDSIDRCRTVKFFAVIGITSLLFVVTSLADGCPYRQRTNP